MISLVTFMTRDEVVARYRIPPELEDQVFAVLQPVSGKDQSARYFEPAVDGQLEKYFKNWVRPGAVGQKSLLKKEDFNVVDFASSQSLERIAGDTNIAALVAALNAQTHAIGSLVATLTPEMPELVGTDYLAHRLGCTPQWVAKMAERGEIPKHCIAPKVSGGRIWKFHREKLDAWLRDREEE